MLYCRLCLLSLTMVWLRSRLSNTTLRTPALKHHASTSALNANNQPSTEPNHPKRSRREDPQNLPQKKNVVAGRPGVIFDAALGHVRHGQDGVDQGGGVVFSEIVSDEIEAVRYSA